MPSDPAQAIANELQAVQRPGESIRKGPGGSLYLGDGRFLVAKYNPMEQRATVHPFDFDDVGEVRVVTGSETRSFVEIEIPGQPAGIADGDEAAYAQRPNVIYCGRGGEAEQMAHQIVRAVHSAIAPPPPPPPPPPPQQFPADWYPDPHGKHRLRYWDGGQWTEHVAD